MEIITIECPKCKGKLHVEEKTEKLFCMYCRAEVVTKQPEISQTEVIVDSVNHEFQAKLAIAKYQEMLYLKGESTLEAITNAYDEALAIGAHHWEYWYSKADFITTIGVAAVKEGHKKYMSEERGQYKVLASRNAYIETYLLWMDKAIGCADGNAKSLREEKEEILNRLVIDLESIKEHKADSNQMMMDRPLFGQEILNYLYFIVPVVFFFLVLMSYHTSI